ncbi:hypothetical protein AX774_g4338 [Zancudomyces culisetae]|uniref:Uncharacterized protein n=1 Tax=Zancudomyces culisetae TaxID=1213189 RepID=A0A1R1PMK9_ZANCU|nr:hypothetical protein AX774_g4338 [Zancudomyces culisetae]|eukprot:OMH82191.1 hypothetical protein AX774_g4338 [Zancudomyces culisetae]
MLCLTEIAHLTYFVNEPWRVQMAKMLCIDHALNGVKILKWGYNKISIAYMDLNLYISVYWIMSALINASYITDLPNHSQVVEGLEFVFQFLSKIEPKFMNRGMAVDSFKRAINVKEYYHGINTKSNMIPTILANASLTATDINPWFIMGTPASVGYTCCHLANPITAFRTLSLNHYVDFPVISLTPTDCDHLIQVSASFSLFTEYIDKCFINTTPERYLLIKNKKFNDFDKIPEVNQQNNLNRIQVSNLVYRSFKYYSWSREDANTFITSFLNLVFSSS